MTSGFRFLSPSFLCGKRWLVIAVMAFSLAAACTTTAIAPAGDIRALPANDYAVVSLGSEVPRLEETPPWQAEGYPQAEREVGNRVAPESEKDAENSRPAAGITRRNEYFAVGRAFFASGDLRSARTALSRALDEAMADAEVEQAVQVLNVINAQLFASAEDSGDMLWHTVQRGDSLASIAQRYATSWQFLRRINGLSGNVIRIGEKLKAPRQPLTLRIRKSEYVADIMMAGDIIKRYRVGLSATGNLPAGAYKVKNRVPSPSDGIYPAGHEKNRLGSHWIGLRNVADEGQSLGIHGCPASEEKLIGSEHSQGGVSVTNADVAELFDLLPTGAMVEIAE